MALHAVDAFHEARMRQRKVAQQASQANGHWLDVDGVRKHLCLPSRHAVYRLVERAVRPMPYERLGRSYRFWSADVDAWVRSEKGV